MAQNMQQDVVHAFMESLVHKRKTFKELQTQLTEFFGTTRPIVLAEMTTEVDCDFRLIFGVSLDDNPKYNEMCGTYEIWYLDTREKRKSLGVKYITEVNCDFLIKK